MDYVLEPEKRIPVMRDVDVAVAGAGVSGLFAALGAAARGARVVLIDRFGQLGGNMGPGLFIGSRLYDQPGKTLHVIDYPGIPRRFVDRLEAMLAPDAALRGYPAYTLCISRLAADMLDEAGVERLLSAYAADPVLEGGRVRGLFVETKSGRVAVRAKVVVDATGDADVARRSGAPCRSGSTPAECDSPNIHSHYNKPQYATWNDGGVYFVMARVDINAFRAFCRQECVLDDAEQKWQQANLDFAGTRWPAAMVRLFRAAAGAAEFRPSIELWPRAHVALLHWFEDLGDGLAGGRAHVMGEYDSGNCEHVSRIESAVRSLVFDSARFFRGRVPGFEKSLLLFVSPFLGSRGGPHIEGEYLLTPQELYRGASAPDSMFRSYVDVRVGGSKQGCDMPYRMLLPRGIDGLLVTGRGMSYLRRGHDPGVRARCNMMMLGQATGVAAAMCATEGVCPRHLDVRKLQRALLAEGFPFGDEARLQELGLAP